MIKILGAVFLSGLSVYVQSSNANFAQQEEKEQLCKDEVALDVKFCSTALHAPTTSGAAPGDASVGQASASQIVTSASQRSWLQDALDYCKQRLKRCYLFCPTEGKAPQNNADFQQCSQILARGRLPSGITCSSPLIIKMGAEPIALTPPSPGVLFDLLGLNAAPAHEPVRISWLKKESLETNYFLALPDEEGRVKGIDQLFGNNSQGPDQQFAPNGFEALRKYDGLLTDGRYDKLLRDGKIDRYDPVFARLRAWHDLNGDGIADLDELVPLTDLGIEQIDLEVSQFMETDTYGNTLNSRTLVTLADQSWRVMFDLWFAL